MDGRPALALSAAMLTAVAFSLSTAIGIRMMRQHEA